MGHLVVGMGFVEPILHGRERFGLAALALVGVDLLTMLFDRGQTGND